MEREILLTGIGGQGVQLAANTLAHAALSEGRDVQVFGSYGGMMRGGNTDAAVVVADERIESPPTVDEAWAAVLMHPDYSGPVLVRVRPGGLVLRNTGVWSDPLDRDDVEQVDLDASELAVGAGHLMAAAMVMLGALCAITDLVDLGALRAGMRACVPPYRRQHIELNDRALEAGGAAVVSSPERSAWTEMASGHA
jgi:2-oxoglutarate ferredoxin oxidoreductase subunit gamma